MKVLRQGTAQTIVVGPFISITDGYTVVTDLVASHGFAYSTTFLSKNGAALAAANASAVVAADSTTGFYRIAFTASDTDTLGILRVFVNMSAGGALPLWEDYMVIPQQNYDMMYRNDAMSAILINTGVAVGNKVTMAACSFGSNQGSNANSTTYANTALMDASCHEIAGGTSGISAKYTCSNTLSGGYFIVRARLVHASIATTVMSVMAINNTADFVAYGTTVEYTLTSTTIDDFSGDTIFVIPITSTTNTPTTVPCIRFYKTGDLSGYTLKVNLAILVSPSYAINALPNVAAGGAGGLLLGSTAASLDNTDGMVKVQSGATQGQLSSVSGVLQTVNLLNQLGASAQAQAAAAVLGAAQSSYVAAGTVGATLNDTKLRVLSALPNAVPGGSGGLPILNANSQVPAVLSVIGNVKGVTDPVVASGGHVTSVTGNILGAMVGNVGGSVLGTVIPSGGHVASVTGNVNGNVAGNVNGNVIGNINGTLASMTVVAQSQVGAACDAVVSVRTNALEVAIESAYQAALAAKTRTELALPDVEAGQVNGLPVLDASLNVSSTIDPTGIWDYELIDIVLTPETPPVTIGQLIKSCIPAIQTKTDLLEVTLDGELLLQVQGVVAGSITSAEFTTYMQQLDAQRFEVINDAVDAIQATTDKFRFKQAGYDNSTNNPVYYVKSSLPLEDATGTLADGPIPAETVYARGGHIDTVDTVEEVADVTGNVAGNVQGSVLGSVDSVINPVTITGVTSEVISEIGGNVEAIMAQTDKMQFVQNDDLSTYDLITTLDNEFTEIDTLFDAADVRVLATQSMVLSAITMVSSVQSAVDAAQTDVTAVKERTDRLSFVGDGTDLKVTLDSEAVAVSSIEASAVLSIWDALLSEFAAWDAQAPTIGGLLSTAIPSVAPDADGGLVTGSGIKLDTTGGKVLLQDAAVDGIWDELQAGHTTEDSAAAIMRTAAADALASKTRVEKALPDVDDGAAGGLPVLDGTGNLVVDAATNDFLTVTDFETAIALICGEDFNPADNSLRQISLQVAGVPEAVGVLAVDSAVTLKTILTRLNAAARGRVRMTELSTSPIGITWYNEADEPEFSVQIDGRDRNTDTPTIDNEVTS